MFPPHRQPRFHALVHVLFLVAASALHAAEAEVDLLVVGGSESGVAAAVQAARLGVPSIALVNDIDWLGGQFTAEGLGAVDEWTIYKGQRTYFPRSGLYLEIMDAIEADMGRKYGAQRPGKSFCAWTTCEPRDTERLFRRLVEPYLKANGGPITVYEHFEPAEVFVHDKTVRGVKFESVRDAPPLTIRARLTIDASDWGDVIRLSGAAYSCGPDLKSRFDEPGAPTDPKQVEPNEMNPLTWCLVLRESDGSTIIDRPPHYDERRYFATTLATKTDFERLGWPAGTMRPFAPAWRDSTMSKGPYNEPPTVYTHRRLVDRRHLQLAEGAEAVLVNWPLQDYPTYNFPRYVVERLEADEPSASRKNLVRMTPRQRRIVFADAKAHALGLLYHLQTTVAERDRAAVTFCHLKLTDEFGTPDRLPPKPYIREGLRLEALYMLREQDVRDTDHVQSWAREMFSDGVFGFQFNIDFHPTKRIFLGGDNAGPWAHIHSPYRNWSTHTDRACFPLRSLIPIEMDGLLGAGKNLGYSSIVSSAVRIHPHGVLVGQAAGATAALCLENAGRSPRQLAGESRSVKRLQRLLVEPAKDPFTKKTPPGVLLWPYQDVPTDSPHFAAVNLLAMWGILPGVPGSQDCERGRTMKRGEVARATRQLAIERGTPADQLPSPVVGDSDSVATVAWAADWFLSQQLAAPDDRRQGELRREDLAKWLWRAWEDRR